MNYKNRFGQYAGSYWNSMKLENRVVCVIFVTCIAAILVAHYSERLFTSMTRELAYIAAPRAMAEEVKTPAEILQAIADCESGIRNSDGSAVAGSARQFGKNGKPIKNVNKSGGYAGSVDVGWAQINITVHIDEIARMGLDVISSEEDNKEFAMMLYEREGTQPWSASKSCWDR